MDRLIQSSPCLMVISLFVLMVSLSAWGESSALNLPSADVVMSNVVQRALAVTADSNDRYGYDKVSVTEELDARGKVKSRKEKLYAVIQIGGLPHQRLVRVKDQWLSPEQLQEQDRKEQEARREFEGGKKSGKRENRSPELTAELVGRFKFIVRGAELIQDRPALRLDFRPRSGELPAKHLADRVINKLAGTVWVDEREFEIVRADLKLIEPVTIWGGVLGTWLIQSVAGAPEDGRGAGSTRLRRWRLKGTGFSIGYIIGCVRNRGKFADCRRSEPADAGVWGVAGTSTKRNTRAPFWLPFSLTFPAEIPK